jgi:hypothetical protein
MDAKVFINRESERGKVIVRYFKVLVYPSNISYPVKKVITSDNKFIYLLCMVYLTILSVAQSEPG